MVEAQKSGKHVEIKHNPNNSIGTMPCCWNTIGQIWSHVEDVTKTSLYSWEKDKDMAKKIKDRFPSWAEKDQSQSKKYNTGLYLIPPI